MKFDLKKLDFGFIKNAEHAKSFSLEARDFQSTKYKNEIQFIIGTQWFKNFDLTKTISSTSLNASKINTLIKQLKNTNSRNFDNLFKYNLSGLGNGEVLLYFLLDKASLGGGSSSGLDIVIGNEGYEMKAVNISADGYAYGFFTGRTLNVSAITERLATCVKDEFEGKIPASTQEIRKSAIGTLRENKNKTFLKIENDYRDLVYNNYFSKHKTIFFDNKTGEIAFMGIVDKPQIFIETVTQSQIKPMIKIK
jgi:hypothetical protein